MATPKEYPVVCECFRLQIKQGNDVSYRWLTGGVGL